MQDRIMPNLCFGIGIRGRSEKSGYLGDPAKLPIGAVVGRNNALIEYYDTGLGVEIKNSLGETFFNNIREFLMKKGAFPARQVGIEEIKEFFKENGLELKEFDIKTDELQAGVGNNVPWWEILQDGKDVHDEIAKEYEVFHATETIRSNYYPVKSILSLFPEEHKLPMNQINMPVDKKALKKPDITNITKLKIYEIKPDPHQDKAKEGMKTYMDILNNALPIRFSFSPGPSSDPGAHGDVTTKKNKKYTYRSPEDGVILYSKVKKQEEHNPNPHSVPLVAPKGELKQRLMQFETETGLYGPEAIFVFTVLFFLALIFPQTILMPSLTPGIIPITPKKEFGPMS